MNKVNNSGSNKPKFIDPNKLLTPVKCKVNIARSTLGPLWLCNPDNGG
jgi:hypothetical protein